MAEKNFNTRIVHKHDIEANWALAVNFTPKQGELIVYDIDENYFYERFKIGDGISNVNDLPFCGEGEKIYKQAEEPLEAEEGALWIDLDTEVTSDGAELDITLTQEGKAADAKAVGEGIASAFNELNANKAETETYKGTLLSSGWSSSAPYTQSITVNGILSTDYPFVDIDLSDVSDTTAVIEAWKMVGRCTVSADNTVIAYCYEEKPTVAIPIIFKVVR